LSRGGSHADEGGSAGRERNWIHRAVDEHVTGGGIFAYSVDGRNRWPAVPGIRHYARGCDLYLADGVAHHDADDVREISAFATRQKAQLPVPGKRKRVQPDPPRLR